MAQQGKTNIQRPPRILHSLEAATEYLWQLYRSVALEPRVLGDSASIEGLATQVTIDLEVDQGSTGYQVLLQVTGRTGTPAADSDQVDRIVKEAKRFTVVFKAAPGAGNSITFDWQTRR